MTKLSELERQEAIDHLKGILKPGDTVFTKLEHVSKSGMSRSISVIIIRNDNPQDITFWAAEALGYNVDQKYGGIKIGGCGMDMGFELIYNLSRTLWPNGFTCIGKDNCPSNDHFNGDQDYTPHNHSDGGYALRQRWL